MGSTPCAAHFQEGCPVTGPGQWEPQGLSAHAFTKSAAMMVGAGQGNSPDKTWLSSP